MDVDTSVSAGWPLTDAAPADLKPAPKAKKPKAAGKVISFPAKKAAKPKAAKAKQKAKAAKPKKKPKKKAAKPKAAKAKQKAKAAAPAVVRSERLDLRLSKREKAMLRAKAVKLRRTLTSIFIEFVEKLK